MISIERPPAPKFLSDHGAMWYKETQNAILHYNGVQANEAFDFNAYNHSRLKNELKKVFCKCAYCESRYDFAYDGDVEHFRPKGKVSEKTPPNPGYYWLANDWDNLFLSCQHCNQSRKHILYNEEELRAQGKRDQFPLSDETRRVCTHTQSLDEEEKFRLLINPCKDKPEKHFKYNELGLIISDSEKGKKTIEVCALQRSMLVNERRRLLLSLLKQMNTVKRELERYNVETTQRQKDVLHEELNNLMDFTKSDSIYAGLARYFVKQFLNENKI